MSSISVPRWSVVYECHKGECALMSAVMRELGMFVAYCMQLVMSESCDA